MSSQLSPSIITSGLIYYHDLGNTAKSWQGEPSTNLYVSPNNINTGWTKTAAMTITESAVIAPDGTLTAANVYANGSTNSYITNAGSSITTGTTYTKTLYAKAGTTGVLVFEDYDNNGAGAAATYPTYFDLNAGTVTSTASGTTASITAIGYGWYRCRTTRAYTLNTSSGTFYIGAYGTGTGSVYMWHPQMEAKAYPTTYANSARSTTTAILDITNNYAITATSLTYNNDGATAPTWNGTSNYANVNIADATINAGSWTMSAWCYFNSVSRDPTGSSADNSIFCHGASVVNNGGLHLNERNGVAYMGFWANDLAGVTKLSAARWYNITWAFDYTTKLKYIYLNAVLENSGGTIGYSGTGSNFAIGSFPSANWYMNGQIQAVKIYNRLLSSDELVQNFNALRGRFGV